MAGDGSEIRLRAPAANTRGATFALLAFAVYSTHDVVVKLLGADLLADPDRLLRQPLRLSHRHADADAGPQRRQPPPAAPVLDGAAHGGDGGLDHLRLLRLQRAADGADLRPDLRRAAAHHHPRHPGPRRDRRLAADGRGLRRAARRPRRASPRQHRPHRRACRRPRRRRLLGDRRRHRPQDRPRRAQRRAAALSDGGELRHHGVPARLRLPADAGDPHRRAGDDGAPRLLRRPSPDRRLPQRKRGRRRADAVFADPLGRPLRGADLRRDPDLEHRHRRGDHHRQRHLRRLPRGPHRHADAAPGPPHPDPLRHGHAAAPLRDPPPVAQGRGAGGADRARPRRERPLRPPAKRIKRRPGSECSAAW